MAPRSEAVLITGSSGFTGLRLAAKLREQGRRVVGLTRSGATDWEIEGDLTDPEAVTAVIAEARPAVVVHLAGITFPAHPSPAEIYQANVVGTSILLDALARAEAPPELVIVSSSATVYDQSDVGDLITEEHPCRPLNHYGISKLAVEHIARLASKTLPIQVARPFNYTGPGQSTDFLVPKIVDHFARGAERIELGNLDLHRDISALDDVVQSYLRLIERGRPGEVVNICSGQGVFLRDIIADMREVSGRDMVVDINPKFVRADEPKTIVGSRARLDAAIGAWPRTPFRDVLAGMYAAAKAA